MKKRQCRKRKRERWRRTKRDEDLEKRNKEWRVQRWPPSTAEIAQLLSALFYAALLRQHTALVYFSVFRHSRQLRGSSITLQSFQLIPGSSAYMPAYSGNVEVSRKRHVSGRSLNNLFEHHVSGALRSSRACLASRSALQRFQKRSEKRSDCKSERLWCSK